MVHKLLNENAEDIVWIYNLLQNKFTFIGSYIDNIVGYQVKDLINLPGEHGVGAGIKALLKHEIKELLIQRSVNQSEKDAEIFTVLELVCRNNRHTLIEIVWKPVYDKNGIISDLMGVGKEISSKDYLKKEVDKILLRIDVRNADSADSLSGEYKIQNYHPKSNKLDWKYLDMTYNLVDQNPDVVIISDLSGKIEYVNSAIIHETGEEPDAIIGKHLHEWLSRYYEHNLQYKYFLYAIETGQSWTGTMFRQMNENQGIWEQVRTTPIILDRDNSSHMSITIKNVNREKLIEEELKKNKRQGMKKLIDSHDSRIIGLIEGEERERRRFASDLHDGLGQVLTAAKYCLEGLTDIIPERYIDEFRICVELMGSAISETRNISHGLMPSSLADFGLMVALGDLCQHTLLISSQPIRFEFRIQDELHFDAFKEMMIFRIVQEGINNIQKHAGATEATISLKKENDQVVLLISDNGLGFEINKSNLGLGLLSIRNRTKLLGGCCNIKSEPGKGTQIRISFHQKINLNLLNQ